MNRWEVMVLKEIYNQRFLRGYRQELSGYELARWSALSHFLVKVAPLTDVKRVLDFGCGNGLHVPLWESLFPNAELYFCDISEVALSQLKQTYPRYGSRCHLVEGAETGLAKEQFDLILSVEVLEHVESVPAFLAEVRRLLLPGGRFVWTTPCANRFSIEHLLALATRRIDKTKEGFRRWRWEDPGHLRRLRSGEMKMILREAGFDRSVLRYRAHIFSALCTLLLSSRLAKSRSMARFLERMMDLDYMLFRRFPNGASMIGSAIKAATNG